LPKLSEKPNLQLSVFGNSNQLKKEVEEPEMLIFLCLSVRASLV